MRAVKPKLAVAAAIALAGAGGGAYMLWPKSPAPRVGCYPTALGAAAKRQLAADARRIEYSAVRQSDGERSLTWRDPVTGRSREVSYDTLGAVKDVFGTFVQGRTERVTFLIYDGRRAVVEQHSLPRTFGRVDAASESQSYRTALRDGRTHVVGLETLAGKRLLHARVASQLAGHTIRIDAWLDPATFLPVLTRTEQGSSGAVDREAWLPRTPANVAKTIVRVPRGFRIVHPGSGKATTFDEVTSRRRTPARCDQS